MTEATTFTAVIYLGYDQAYPQIVRSLSVRSLPAQFYTSVLDAHANGIVRELLELKGMMV